MVSEYKTLEQQIIELWKSSGMTVIQERFHLDTWIITAEIVDQKNKIIDYKIIEQKIRDLWQSRGMNVRSITFKGFQWTIIADRKPDEEK
jgi:hypothetical protein